MNEVSQALSNIKKKKAAAMDILKANKQRTARLWRRASGQEWQYHNDFIRGKFAYTEGLPHVFEGTCPRYLMSGAELNRHGMKPGEAQAVAHTYNQKAGLYYLYDVRECQPINSAAARDRLKKAIATHENAIKEGYPGRGREIVLQVLREHRDIPF